MRPHLMNEPVLESLGGARGPRRSRAQASDTRYALLSLTMLAVAGAACSGSSGGSQKDALGQVGATGGDGAAGSGPGAGNAATDASVPRGSGSGGSGGGGGGGSGGGTPSPCPDPSFPVSCPARNDVPAICWSAGTECSTIAKCGDQFRSCTSPNARYDCAEMRCVSSSSSGDGGVECGDPSFPVSCPATSDVPKLCWSPGTVCSTIGRCGNEFKSCLAAGYRFSCSEQKCVQGPASDGGAAIPDASVADAAPADAAPADTRHVDSD